jgi:hypothetical protein
MDHSSSNRFFHQVKITSFLGVYKYCKRCLLRSFERCGEGYIRKYYNTQLQNTCMDPVYDIQGC